MKLGLIREGKIPPDKRVPFTPDQCRMLIEQYSGLEIFAESSEHRCYSDEEYRNAGVEVIEDMSNCDVLMGVKEVPIEELIPDKTYFFFSHTIKKQPYNKRLLQTILERNIRLVDYECLVDSKGFRIIGFGRYAGIVGCYNAFYTYGKKYDLYDLKRAYQCADRAEMEAELDKVKLPAVKIFLTGGGRVAKGAMEVLDTLQMRQVPAEEFLSKEFDEPVFCQIDVDEYRKHKDGILFDFNDFFANPQNYESTFLRYTKVTDMYIACHFWNAKAPMFFTRDDMISDEFRIKVVADISCDIDGPIASTIRASTVDDPIYGYSPEGEAEVDYKEEEAVAVMAVDNLPCELPKDASEDFGMNLIEQVIPHLIGDDSEGMINSASIAANGKLGEKFQYLSDYVSGVEEEG